MRVVCYTLTLTMQETVERGLEDNMRIVEVDDVS
jgi:hypothetical protein